MSVSTTAFKLNFNSARRKLARDGIAALQAQRYINREEQQRYAKPAISKRVANVLRKQAIEHGAYVNYHATNKPDASTILTAPYWDAAWDQALFKTARDNLGRHFLREPKKNKRERTRADRIKKIDEKLEGMDDRIHELWETKREARKIPMDFESVFKRAMSAFPKFGAKPK